MEFDLVKEPFKTAQKLYQSLLANDLGGMRRGTDVEAAIYKLLEMEEKARNLADRKAGVKITVDASAFGHSGETKEDMEAVIKKAVQDTDVEAAYQRFEALQNLSMRHQPVASAVVNEIYSFLQDAGKDASALDRTGQARSAEEMDAVIAEAARNTNLHAAKELQATLDSASTGHHVHAEPILNQIHALLADSKLDASALGTDGQTAQQVEAELVQATARADKHQFLNRAEERASAFIGADPKRVNAENSLMHATHLLDSAGMAAVAEHMNTTYQALDAKVHEALGHSTGHKNLTPVLEVRTYSDENYPEEKVAAIDAKVANAPKAADLGNLLEEAKTLIEKATGDKPQPLSSDEKDALRSVFGKTGLALLDERGKRDPLVEHIQQINSYEANREAGRTSALARLEQEREAKRLAAEAAAAGEMASKGASL